MSLVALRQRVWSLSALLFVAALTACGGGGSSGGGSTGGGALPSTPSSITTPGPIPLSVVSVNGSSITLTGTINAVITGGFSIQGGPSIGYLRINTSSSTIINGPAPYVGENVEVTGVGSTGTSVQASQVWQITSTPIPSANPSASPIPTPVPTGSGSPASPSPSGTPIPVPSGVLQVVGQIGSVSSTKISVQTGASCGWMYVYVNSSTVYFNGTPQAGQYGTFTGPGTRCSSITAGSVSLSASSPGTTTASGTVTQATSYGFTLTTSAAASPVPVALSSSSVVYGAALTTGSNVTVSGLGSLSAGLTATNVAVAAPTPSPVASPTPTPGPISIKHVMTAGLVYGYAGTPTTVPVSSVAPWMNWVQTSEPYAAGLRSNGIKVDVYTNFWRNYTSDNPIIGYNDLKPGGAHANAEAKDCSGNVIYDSTYGGGYEADARSSDALGHAQTVVNYDITEFQGNYDAIFSDDSGAVGGITPPCNYTQASYDAAVNSVHSALGLPMWLNAFGAAQDPAAAVDLLQPSNVLGAMCEECYADNPSTGDIVQRGASWTNFENAEINTVAAHKIFWDYARASGPAASETAIRTYIYASFLLSYDPNYTMLQTALQTPSGFEVFPEVGLVPLNPLTTATNVSGYQAPGGASMREFGACYYQGNFVNRCAVVVNATGATVPVPTTSYAHSLVLSGAGVLDGGTAAFNGTAPTQLAPGNATILFP